MNTNVGQADRSVRITLGALAGIVSLAGLADVLALPTLAAPLLGIAAVLLLATATTRFCGVYALLGVDTCSLSDE